MSGQQNPIHHAQDAYSVSKAMFEVAAINDSKYTIAIAYEKAVVLAPHPDPRT